MRDSDGIYLGNHACVRYGGFSSYFDKKCCEGRITKLAKCVCMLKGVVEAELECNARCDDRKEII